MGTTTKIQWTDHTFNPWIGCAKVHAGCANCYAEADFDIRRKRVTWGPNGTRSRTSDANWKEPLKWNRLQQQAIDGLRIDPVFFDEPLPRPRVFCASLADVFEHWDGLIVDHKGNVLKRNLLETGCVPMRHHDDDPPASMNDLRTDLFRLFPKTPNLDWLLLTKRSENIRRMIDETVGIEWWIDNCKDNVWLGTSVSDQETADRMIPELLKCRDLAAKLFVSYEPALGPVNFTKWLAAIDWLIVGGESGKNARPCNVDWIRSIVEQCKAAGVPCFVKQFGSNVDCRCDDMFWRRDPKGTCNDNRCRRVILSHPKGGDPSEWPEDLRVQEFPSEVGANSIGGNRGSDADRISGVF